MMQLKINPLVTSDLKSIKDFIAEDNTEMAEKTIREILKNFEVIQRFPYIGSDLKKRVRFYSEYKYVVEGNYIILYKIKDISVANGDECFGVHPVLYLKQIKKINVKILTIKFKCRKINAFKGIKYPFGGIANYGGIMYNTIGKS